MDRRMTTDAIVELHGIGVRYPARRGLRSGGAPDVVAVDGVSLVVERGRTLGIVGATGSGKSTLAHVIVGMVEPTSGSLTYAGRPAADGTTTPPRRSVQVVLQDPYSSLDPRTKVRDIIAEPLTLGRFVGRGAERDRIDARVIELLGLVGFGPEKAELYPHQFSGGQRQRIAIARALAPEPDLIVLDEPTSALDVSVRAQILNLLRSLQERLGVTYLVISHDLVTVAFLASTVAVMHLGRIVELGPTSALYRTPRHPYTVELLASIPDLDGAFLRPTLPVEPPASPLGATPCRYAVRCALRARLGDPDRCLEADPALAPVGPDHSAACHFSDEIGRLSTVLPSPAITPAQG
jgi:oligopeptide/dipeptide ABC transporter ATP-binding protein